MSDERPEPASTAVELGVPGLDDVEEIGRGGFGVVYRARQKALNRMVAVKVLGAGLDEVDRERVAREAWAMGTLSGHPNIVNVFDVGTTPGGAQYILMSYLAQGSMAARLAAEGPLAWSEAVRITVKLAGAVEMAHRAGTLHRDIKPENVLMSDYGEPQLADFGIARVEGRFEKATGQFTASVVHAAPEVLDGRSADVAADVYSLGSTLFTMLAGRPAFTRRPEETLAALFIRIVRDPVPDLRPQGVPDAVCRVVERAMAKDPRERPSSAAELGRALQEVQRRAGLPVAEMPVVLPEPGQAAARAPGSVPVVPDDEESGETEASITPAPPPRRRRMVMARGLVLAAVLAVATIAVLLPRLGGEGDDQAASPGPATTAATPTTLAAVPPGGVPVGTDPTAVASDPRTGRIYVANSGSLSVTVLDGTTMATVATVTLPSRPWGIALNHRTGRVYVTTAESAVTVIDTATHSVTATVPVPSRPWGIAINHRANRVYVAMSDAAVAVIDGERDAVTGTLQVAARPWAVAVIPETNRIYVTSQESRNLTVIDGANGTVVADVDIRTRACGVAVNPRTNRIYVTSLDASAVTVVDGASLTVVDTLLTPTTGCGVAVNPQTNRVYVSTQDTGSVAVLDPANRSVIESRSLFGTTRATEVLPYDIDVNPQGEGVYVVNKTARSLVTASGDLRPP
ncbi:MAG: serine/threonine-protein kinase [Actinomycetota bacterium]|nr:serine/threonine-protein kinase [Actinomycetota bacterium]